MRTMSTGYLYQRNGTFYLQIQERGRRKVVSLKTKSRRDAERKRDEYLAPIVASRTKEDVIHHIGQARKLLSIHNTLIGESWSAYLASPRRTYPKAVSVEITKSSWGAFTRWLEKHTRLRHVADIGAAEVKSYLDALPCSDATKNKHLRNLRQVHKAITGSDALAGIQARQTSRGSKKRFTEGEIVRILGVFDAAPPLFDQPLRNEMKCLFNLGVWTGLRLGDAARLKWENVDFHRGIIALVPEKTNRVGRAVRIPIHPDLRSALKNMPQGIHVMPTLASHYAISADRLVALCRKVFAAAGFDPDAAPEARGRHQRRPPYICFHAFRGTFATFLAMRNVPISVAADIVGDSVATLSKYYVSVDDESRRKALNVLPSIASLPTAEKDADVRLRELRAYVERRRDIPEKVMRDMLDILGAAG